jgi:hypothetical protein
MTIPSIPKSLPTEARYFAGSIGFLIALFLEIPD